MESISYDHDTIVALSTPPGVGAIGVIRLSGENSLEIVSRIFKGKNLILQLSHTAHFGYILDGTAVVDEVVVTIFKAPHSFTRENVAEISCHGSQFILNQVIKLLIKNGARYAKPGEFTQRAFLNGRFDLAQAEAVADLISAENESARKAAMNQMRGGFSKEIKALREQLIHFASLVELELDFAEEDVEFANRDDLKNLIYNILKVLNPLIESFDLGNAIKNGIPTVIAGKPNAGKSTLLNALLNEEKALVSDIAGTTRDVIEDEITLGGIKFRFIDTAGLRQTSDKLEAMGIERTKQKMKEASLILYLFDASKTSVNELHLEIATLKENKAPFIIIGNKVDQTDIENLEKLSSAVSQEIVFISAANKTGMALLRDKIFETVKADNFKTGDTVVTNIRHYESLLNTKNSLDDVITGIENNVTGDFLAMDIRQALHYLGLITGEITTDDLLENIFSKFCIGK